MKYSANIKKIDLFKLSIPIFFSNLALPLVGIVDTTLMGHLNSTKFLAAISISTSVMTMILWSFGFLRMGTVGLISQALGKGDYREISLIISRYFVFAIIISLIIILLKPTIISAINFFFSPSLETFKLINEYISIRVFSAPAELAIYILVGFYLGIQKTNISSLLIIIFSILNILLSIFFVIHMNLGLYGVALGTVLAAYLTVIPFTFYTYFLIKNKFNAILKIKRLFIKSKFIKLLNINYNIFIRTLLLTFSFLWITYQGSKFGEDYLAMNNILIQFIILSSFFLDAYAFATEGVIGFAIGRRSEKTFLKAVKNSIQLSFYTGLFISLIYIFSFKLIINIITDLDILRYLSYGYIFWIIIIPPLASFCYQFDGIFIGASQTSEMRNAMIISVVSFITLSIYFIEQFGNHGLWFSLVLFMIFRFLTLYYYFPRIMKKF
jgi:MATE family multidrug resistance protein|tara:strand:- start:3559 stop:4875 length:1317 start_codon:yes stop_codon:yes gene_type:complete